MDERDDLVTAVDQPLHLRLRFVPATYPVAGVRADGVVPRVGAGARYVRRRLPYEPSARCSAGKRCSAKAR